MVGGATRREPSGAAPALDRPLPELGLGQAGRLESASWTVGFGVPLLLLHARNRRAEARYVIPA